MISGCIDRLAVAVALIGAGGAEAFMMGRGRPPAGRAPAVFGLASARLATSAVVTTSTAGERRATTYERRRSASASKVTMLMLASGAWAPQTRSATKRKLADDVTRFAALGYATVPVAYGDPRVHGVQLDDELANITAAYTRARAANRLGVVCAYGESVGGHLALMLATKIPALDCVIAAASPAPAEQPVVVRRLLCPHDLQPRNVTLESRSPLAKVRHHAGAARVRIQRPACARDERLDA